MKKLPPIIYTEKPDSRFPYIYVYSESFFEMVENLKLEYLFSAVSPRQRNSDFMFFFVKDGFMIILSPRERRAIEDVDIGDFISLDQFLEANYFGIPNVDEFIKFQASGFRDTVTKKDYLNYVYATQKGFPSKNSFEHAMKLGIPSGEEYQEFKKVGVSYDDYKLMVAGGFTDKTEYGAAKQLGIETQKAYLEYITKRYDPYLEKIKEIKKDFEDSFTSKRFEEFIRLGYLLAEKMGELVYYKLFDKQPENKEDVNLSEILASIENKIGKNLNIIDDLHSWRKIRNDIVHEHLKIDQDTANRGGEFFRRFDAVLLYIFNE